MAGAAVPAEGEAAPAKGKGRIDVIDNKLKSAIARVEIHLAPKANLEAVAPMHYDAVCGCYTIGSLSQNRKVVRPLILLATVIVVEPSNTWATGSTSKSTT